MTNQKKKSKRKLRIYFSDFYGVKPEALRDYGAFNISLLNDLPLFIDPFLLFTSKNHEYQNLHHDIIEYVKFLKLKSHRDISDGLLKGWFYFPEIKQNWLGFSKVGNAGRGLGNKFAASLKLNLSTLFQNFGEEEGISPHIEKLTLVKNGVGRDNISDFTCNLIVGYLAKYTEAFAANHIDPSHLARFNVPKVRFDKRTETWAPAQFTLPRFGKDFVLLTPMDMLTKDESWINHSNLVEDYATILAAVPNAQLRAQVDQYFRSIISTKPTKEELTEALEKVIKKYPQVLDVYIAMKEKTASEAVRTSASKLAAAQAFFVAQLTEFADLLDEKTEFYETKPSSYAAGMERVKFIKHVMNGGRGPADFLISYGSKDKTVIEFKLASNTHLADNLLKQAEIYSNSSRATHPPIKVILCFDDKEIEKVDGLLKRHNLKGCKEVVVIDASPEKPSGSRA